MVIGDLVRHNGFPPVEGVVAIIEPSEFVTRVAVLRSDTNTLMWDNDTTWDVLGNINDVVQDQSIENIVDVEVIGTPQECTIMPKEENIIDGEFREIE